MMIPSLSTDQPSQNLEKWEDKHVRLLIECYLKYKDQLGKPQQTKKKVFEKIAEEFNRTSDVVVSGDQCFRKWKKLESKQKEIEDNNSRTGREKKTCLGADNASVKPVFTFETSGGYSSSSSSRPSTPSHVNSESDSGIVLFHTLFPYFYKRTLPVLSGTFRDISPPSFAFAPTILLLIFFRLSFHAAFLDFCDIVRRF